MARISRQYVESVCEFWNLKLIRHEISENRKKPIIRYSVIDSNGNFITKNKELSWCLGAIKDYLFNTQDLGINTWVCEKCKQINYENPTCMSCGSDCRIKQI